MSSALQENDRKKDEFLAILAHELRNPLAPIYNAVHVLQVLTPGQPNVEAARAVIDRQARQLTRLVNDLLDLSRITTGKLDLRPSRIDLNDVLHAIIATTGRSQTNDSVQSKQAGFDHHLFKSVDPAELIGLLATDARQMASRPAPANRLQRPTRP